MRKRRFAVHGSYFGHNYGDVLLVRALSRVVRMEIPDASIIYPQIKNELLQQYEGDQTGLMKIFSAEAVIFSGGGYLGEPEPVSLRWVLRNLKRHFLPFALSVVARKPLAIIGVGVGPLTNRLYSWFVRSLLAYSKVAVVRDEESVEWSQSVLSKHRSREVVSGADFMLLLNSDDYDGSAFDLKKEANLEIDGSDRVLAVHLDAPQEFALKIDLILRALEDVQAAHPTLKVLFIQDRMAASVQKNITTFVGKFPDSASIVTYESPDQLTSLLRQVDSVLTTKLHVGIVSAALGTSVISLPHHVKTPRFWAQLNQPERCIPLAEANEDDVRRLIEEYALVDNAIVVPKSLQEKAEITKRILVDFLQSLNR